MAISQVQGSSRQYTCEGHAMDRVREISCEPDSEEKRSRKENDHGRHWYDRSLRIEMGVSCGMEGSERGATSIRLFNL